MFLVRAGILLAAIGVGFTTSPNGVLYPFEIDTLLTCHVDSPNAELGVEPEQIPRLSFEFSEMQPGHPNEIWLPKPSGFLMPPGVPNTTQLIAFLGDDYDNVLTRTSLPNSQAPRPCEIAPSAEGSAGNQKIHIATAKDPTPALDASEGAFGQNLFRDSLMNDPSVRMPIEATLSRIDTARQILLDTINPLPELCEIHTALCPLNTTWALLPNTYFPRYFAQGTCSGKNCSFPRSKLCEEDFSYIGYVTVLRWDCCFDKNLRQIQWACGWRKVQIPLLCDCTCACDQIRRGI